MHMEDDEEREGEYKLPRHKLLDLTEGGESLMMSLNSCAMAALLSRIYQLRNEAQEREKPPS